MNSDTELNSLPAFQPSQTVSPVQIAPSLQEEGNTVADDALVYQPHNAHTIPEGELTNGETQPARPTPRREARKLPRFLFCFTFIWCCGTFFYAYTTTLEQSHITFNNPIWKLGILNLFSGINVVLISILVDSIFDHIRWVLVSRNAGLPLSQFLGMSPASGPIQVAQLMYSDCRRSSGVFAFLKNEMWNIQR
jgi:hypothetical protein